MLFLSATEINRQKQENHQHAIFFYHIDNYVVDSFNEKHFYHKHAMFSPHAMLSIYHQAVYVFEINIVCKVVLTVIVEWFYIPKLFS